MGQSKQKGKTEGTYRTESKQRLIAYLSERPDLQFTAEQIADGIAGKKSSVYRQLTALCREGSVKKFRTASQTAFVYQYVGDDCDCRNHFHLKCLNCGNLYHLECEISDTLVAHIAKTHQFLVDSGSSMLYGICRECGKIRPTTQQAKQSDDDRHDYKGEYHA